MLLKHVADVSMAGLSSKEQELLLARKRLLICFVIHAFRCSWPLSICRVAPVHQVELVMHELAPGV